MPGLTWLMISSALTCLIGMAGVITKPEPEPEAEAEAGPRVAFGEVLSIFFLLLITEPFGEVPSCSCSFFFLPLFFLSETFSSFLFSSEASSAAQSRAAVFFFFFFLLLLLIEEESALPS
uniref:Secreted protein n=1 Tax=Triticum urartu TaxID=4572 RepID=A0A8R7PMP1_TRIUA